MILRVLIGGVRFCVLSLQEHGFSCNSYSTLCLFVLLFVQPGCFVCHNKKGSLYRHAAIYQISVSTLCLQGIHKLAAQQLRQTIDKICINLQASIVTRSKGNVAEIFFIIQGILLWEKYIPDPV